ncbi:MAG: leucyl/phenylalanyl-tRNA--protein transferase [Desulfobacterales bacterium]
MPVFWLTDKLTFPPPHLATAEGLLAVGGDLSRERLLLAYRKGIFPWYVEGEPILWWSPDPRLVLYPDRLHISRSLRRTLRRDGLSVTLDRDFGGVIAQCARIRRAQGQGTWITPPMQTAYRDLHDIGVAHSVEVWETGRLVGGLYGLCLGGAFFGESMFSRRSDASKVALVFLVHQLSSLGFHFIDCQVTTPHLTRLGAQEIPRRRFLEELGQALKLPTLYGPWDFATRKL